ncbi:ABC transporter ATP-binding protein [Streptomyces albipurpureus]|uniref:ABC transporter ATP-binding protein/permease n=1 Tax=Streptomyces albipurpureus TaxID=2897419 RepID=A0ABT0UM44_9ACTN|nr:ABC transporter ATP-binding protein [Streptomyces sp. CWNU-1]MCM2389504.1 ABC transporter ATP-binding protein/permease [Streptomyces sp. CWNU-1]
MTPTDHGTAPLASPTDVLLPAADTAGTRRAALRLLRLNRGRALWAIVPLVANTLAGLATPLVLGRMVDEVVRHGTDALPTLHVLGAVLAGIAVLQALLGALSHYLVVHVGESMVADLREDVLDRALHLPSKEVERSGRGDLVARITGDVRVVTDAASNAVPIFVTAALGVVLTLVGLGTLDWRFAVAALLAAPIQLRALIWYLGRSKPVYRAERTVEGERAQRLLDALGAVDTVTAMRLGPRHLDAIADRSHAAVRYSLRATRLRTRFFGRLNLAELIGLAAVLALGFHLVREGAVTIGEATAAALFFHRLFDPIGALLSVFDELQEAGAGLARLVGVTLLPRTAVPADPPRPRDSSLALTEVSYSHREGVEVPSGVSLSVAPGERVALVGTTGAGKSTLAQLIAGGYEPMAGTVRIGGVEPREMGRAATRRTVALVTQEVHVFVGTLADDLRLASPGADDAALDRALRAVGADSWIDALPEGLDTLVGAGGHPLTAPQAQQLALARVLLLDPPVVVLDEATAEAGGAGARALEAATEAVLKGRTAVLVAHRLHQAATADRVVVMEEGRIVEEGGHRELLAAQGRYAGLWEAWTAHRPTPGHPTTAPPPPRTPESPPQSPQGPRSPRSPRSPRNPSPR